MRLKYDDTHSGQKLSEKSTVSPHVETPTKRLRNAYETPPHCMETPTQLRGGVNFQRNSGQNGCHYVWYALLLSVTTCHQYCQQHRRVARLLPWHTFDNIKFQNSIFK